jgi:hypothetical protein
MKCQVVHAQPAAGGNMKVIRTAHPTQASAQTALAADKTCKELSDGASTGVGLLVRQNY